MPIGPAAFLGGAALGALSSFIGGERAQDASSKLAASNQAMQREFAQHGIRWRVADAEAAGIHPLYALGANVTPYSPVFADTGASGRGIASAGQQLGRAIGRTSFSRENRLMEQSLNRATLRKAWAEVDLAEQQVAQSFYALQRDAGGVPGDRPMPRPPGYVGVSKEQLEPWYGDAIAELKGILEYLRRADTRGMIDPNYPGTARDLLYNWWRGRFGEKKK